MWLWEWMTPARARGARLLGPDACIELAQLSAGSALGGQAQQLRGRSVLLSTADALSAALALIELDGIARRIVLAPPDLDEAHLPQLARHAQIEACVRSAGQPALPALAALMHLQVRVPLVQIAASRQFRQPTEWVLLTSGTSGPPKLVVHTLESLTHAFAQAAPPASPIVWSTFYDIRRYGGLQILLRALRGADLVLSGGAEALARFIERARAARVTHLTGTASHWRSLLMSGLASALAPHYVRLSGEIADQAILDALREAFPQALVAHAFASTEAGVAFEVEDGRAGFPAEWLQGAHHPRLFAQLRLRDECLQVRSGGTASGYLGEGQQVPPLRDEEGYVDTGDRLEQRAGRYHFMGRSNGVINVGGLKVHPEEVEAVINAHPWVRLSLVKARRSPITGALVSAQVVLREPADGQSRPADAVILAELTAACRARLAPHKVPAVISVVPALAVSAAGKLVRAGA